MSGQDGLISVPHPYGGAATVVSLRTSDPAPVPIDPYLSRVDSTSVADTGRDQP